LLSTGGTLALIALRIFGRRLHFVTQCSSSEQSGSRIGVVVFFGTCVYRPDAFSQSRGMVRRGIAARLQCEDSQCSGEIILNGTVEYQGRFIKPGSVFDAERQRKSI